MQKLTKAEEEIMQALWDIGSGTVGDVRNWLEAHVKEEKPAHSTVSTMLRILSDKGIISHKAHGRTFEYFPLLSKEQYSRQSVEQLVEHYFDGSAADLVSFLVRDERLSNADLEHLKNLLNNSQK
jgi:BlaI family transcriptional regulator, penicillinase repressor